MSCDCGMTLQGLAGQAEKDELSALIAQLDGLVDQIDAMFSRYGAALKGGNFGWWADNWLSWRQNYRQNAAKAQAKDVSDWTGWSGWISGFKKDVVNLVALRDELMAIKRTAETGNAPPRERTPGTPNKPGAPPPGESGDSLIPGVPNIALVAGAGLLLFAVWRARSA